MKKRPAIVDRLQAGLNEMKEHIPKTFLIEAYNNGATPVCVGIGSVALGSRRKEYKGAAA